MAKQLDKFKADPPSISEVCRKRKRDGDITLRYNFTKKQWRYKDSYDGVLRSINIGLHVFQAEEEANQYYRRLDSFKSPHVIRPRLIDSDSKYFLVITDPIPSISIGDWIQKQNAQPVKDESRLIFRGILKGLELLHDNNKYHGNLWKGVYIDGQNVLFTDYSDDVGVPRLLAGIRKDLSDFKRLLMMVNDFSINHHGYGLYLRLHKQMPKKKQNPKQKRKQKLQDLRDFAFFIYHNPLFWDLDETYAFILKLWELRKVDENYFDGKWALSQLQSQSQQQQQQTSLSPNQEAQYSLMNGWQQAISSIPLGEVYTHRLKGYAKEASFFSFMRNSFAHYQEKNSAAGTFMSDCQKDLDKCFPEGASRIFYRMFLLFNDSGCQAHFNIGLVPFLRTNPLPLK